MNTIIQEDRHALPIKMFTEADVIASLQAVQKHANIPGMYLQISTEASREPANHCAAIMHDDGARYGLHIESGATIAEAIEGLRRRVRTPSQIAASKRAAAQKLNDEACALELAAFDGKQCTPEMIAAARKESRP